MANARLRGRPIARLVLSCLSKYARQRVRFRREHHRPLHRAGELQSPGQRYNVGPLREFASSFNCLHCCRIRTTHEQRGHQRRSVLITVAENDAKCH
jgi:hypothetical protein